MSLSMNKMRDDQDFNIHFVKIIQQSPALYDKSLPEYRSKDEHERIWNKISSEVSESVSVCKERWRNLRACLTRHLKQQQTASENGAINHKPYYLADHMAFLLPFTKSRSLKEQIKYETPAVEQHKPGTSTKIGHQVNADATTTTTYTISTADSDENQYVTLIQTSSGEHNEVLETSAEVEQKALPEVQAYSTASVLAPKDQHMEQIIYEPVPAKRIKMSPETHQDDADLEFFRSLLPDMRMMAPSQKRRFKMGIFGLIDKVLTNTDVNP